MLIKCLTSKLLVMIFQELETRERMRDMRRITTERSRNQSSRKNDCGVSDRTVLTPLSDVKCTLDMTCIHY